MRSGPLPFLLFLFVLGYLVYASKEDREAASKILNQTEGRQSEFSEGLPEEYLPQELNRFSNRDKLEADLNYRREKLELSLREEMANFENNFDVTGKDKEDFEELIQDHKRAREAFKTGAGQALRSFREAEATTSATRGLR